MKPINTPSKHKQLFFSQGVFTSVVNITAYGKKGIGLPQQAEVAQGVPGRLRPRIFLTFGTTRVVGRLPHRQPLPQEKSLVLILRG